MSEEILEQQSEEELEQEQIAVQESSGKKIKEDERNLKRKKKIKTMKNEIMAISKFKVKGIKVKKRRK